jgi:hypothetical protein
MAFARPAEEMKSLQEGQWGVCCGKLVGGFNNMTGKATMTFMVREFNVLEIPQAQESNLEMQS